MGKIVATNRKARHNYSVEDSFEAGIVLTGTEIKSVRDNAVNLQDAYARIENGEAWLVGARIAPWAGGNINNHERWVWCVARSTTTAVATSRPGRPSATWIARSLMPCVVVSSGLARTGVRLI